MLQAGEVLQNRFEIIKMIGKGGMSTVYQARDLVTGKLLAVKDVERAGKEQNQVVEQSLVAEGKMLMQLSNPHLPQIHSIIENQDSFMLVMDFIEGESLDKVIARTGAQSVELVLDWGMQICEVFHYLHNQPTPIIYRDMKPANVMLQPDGKLMMIDFGTARTEKIGVTMQADTICIGTAGFAAPEQYGGIGQSTARTDIFCLGSTLYNMITGHSPCDKPTGILPLEQWNPALANSPIAEIIYKCTRPDPNERYQTAWELYEDLHLASTGAYQSATKRGRSGALSGGLKKSDWQKHDSQGLIVSGLSGLLHKNRTGKSNELQGNTPAQQATPEETVSQSNVHGSGWQRQDQLPVQPVQNGIPAQSVTDMAENTALEQEKSTRMHKLILILMLVAGIFIVLAVLLALLQATGAAIVFLAIALLSAGCGAVMLVLSRRAQ